MAFVGETWPPMPLLPLAACREVNPKVFFPERGQPVGPALAVCRSCPELEPCREWALSAPVTLTGIFGGLSQLSRKAERRRRQTPGISLAIDQVEMESTPIEVLDEVPRTNGNGHEPTAPPRTCRGCGQPIDGPPSRQWCSEQCRRRVYRSEPGRAAAPRREAPTSPVTVVAGLPGLPAIDGYRPVAYLLEASGQLLPILGKTNNGT